MRRVLAPLLLLVLAGCFGNDKDDSNNVRVRPMPWDGSTLGYAVIARHEDWRAYVTLADVLEQDADTDKDRRVMVHEFGHVVAIDKSDGVGGLPKPEGYGPHWYVHDADSKPPGYPMPPEEGRWFATSRRLDVIVEGNAWLKQTVQEAIDTINQVAGKIVFVINERARGWHRQPSPGR